MKTKPPISRRNFIKKASLTTIALATANFALAQKITHKKPNILFIAVDDLRCQLGCYGHSETISPNIDKLAAEGTIFKRAYCQVPVCGPSRVSVLTGVRPDSSMWKCSDLKTRFKTLPALFKDNGYYAISNGKVFHHMHDQEQDWSQLPWRSVPIYHGQGDWAKYNSNKLWQDDESGKNINPKTARGPYFDCADMPDNAYQDGKVAEKTIADLKRLKDMDKPFFLACGFWRPHLPFNAPKKYWDLYKREDIKLADNRYKPKDLPSQCRNSSEINQYGLVANRKSDENFHRQARHGYYPLCQNG
ncbi:MAG: sulfatase-like hydrolase/transferase [Phycisphaerae bacterium]|nr:sulfatase-like hydrolase/transferase [Phycisphaerae bacterium]